MIIVFILIKFTFDLRYKIDFSVPITSHLYLNKPLTTSINKENLYLNV